MTGSPSAESALTRPFGPLRLYRISPPKRRRFAQVLPGLVVFGLAMSLAIEANLGVSPWTAFHQGISERTGLTIGTVTVLTGVVLLFAYPLIDQPMGIGTLLNASIVGPAIDLWLWLIPDLTAMPVRIAALAAGPMLLGLGSGLYIGAGLGPGPRDGLMTAMEQRGLRIGVARATIEITVLILGWILGGDVGLGTAWIALSTAFWVDLFLRPPLRLDHPEAKRPE